MTDEQKCLILIMFRIQNGHRKLSEFADIGTYSDCYISELELDGNDPPSSYCGCHWFLFLEECRRWDDTRSKFETFPIFDYISFEDKIGEK